jgi:hypothetical protein
MRQSTVLEIWNPGNDRHRKPVAEPLGNFKDNVDTLCNDKIGENAVNAADEGYQPSPAKPGACHPFIDNGGCSQQVIEGRTKT